jgi:hypothetical protein
MRDSARKRPYGLEPLCLAELPLHHLQAFFGQLAFCDVADRSGPAYNITCRIAEAHYSRATLSSRTIRTSWVSRI